MRLCINSKAAHEEKEIEKHIKDNIVKQKETSKETSKRIVTIPPCTSQGFQTWSLMDHCEDKC